MKAARGLLLTVLAALCALAAGSMFDGAAQAAVTHQYLSSPITEVPAKGPPPPEEAVAFPGPLGGVSNMAVDSGDLYLIRSGDLLDEFNDSTGAFVAQFPRPESPYFDFHQGIAVGHGAGETEVYVGGDESGGETQGRIAVYDATGHLQGFWDGSDTPAGHFGCFECGGDGGVAADDSGNLLTNGLVYVVDPLNDVVDVFEPKAGGGEKYVAQITGPEPGVPFTSLGGARAASVAVDQASGDVLVMEGTTVVDVFEPTALGEYTLVRKLTGTAGGAFELISGVTADGASGDIYVWEAERKVVDQFSSAGVYLGHLTGTANTPTGAFGVPNAVAVDPASGDVYVGDTQVKGELVTSVHIFGPSVVIPDVTTEPASSVQARAATLHGTVNPDEAGGATCRFEWGTSEAFGKQAPCEPEAVANGGAPVAVHAALSGLQPDTTYYYRLTASNANGTNPGEAFQDQTFATPGPGIHHQSATTVTSTSATLQATIDPDGAPTTYYFQYGTSAGYGATAPAPPGLELGSGNGDVAVSVHLQGLAPGTTYHYRAVAISEAGGGPIAAEGPDETLTTQSVGGAAIGLPDGRQWEMVSPPNKLGSAILGGNNEGDDIQAAADGDGITYGATSPLEANPAGARSPEVEQALSTRDAPGGWSTTDLTTPYNEGSVPVQLGNVDEYKLFSPDLSLGLVEPKGATPLPPLGSGEEATVYLRTANGGYRAVVTSADLQAPGETLRSEERGREVQFAGASRDMEHVLLQSEKALAPGAPAGGGLYEQGKGHPQLVSVLPGGEPTAKGSLGQRGNNTRMTVSNDGTRVVWEDESRHYLRDTVRGETVAIDAAQGTPEPKNTTSVYQTANTDDSRVFFTSPDRLTAGSTAGEAAGGLGDLYMFEVTSREGESLAGKLTDLTVASVTDETAGVRGVIGASEDGSYVYFVAAGALGDGPEHGAQDGGDNLYVVRYEEAAKTWTAPRFIATLTKGDDLSWGEGGGEDLSYMTSRVSPNGRYLAFMSERSLTGYENRDANSGVPDEEVFLYDAGTRRLACASCNPTGARPLGVFRGDVYQERLWDFDGLWGERWVAGDVPGWRAASLSSAFYQTRYLSNSGRLFFNSSDALVPADVNGEEDVYEYEPTGVTGCGEGSLGGSIVATEGGCVGLISAGTSSEESAFMDASESGGDVFFLTESRLSSQDYDNSLDLYDAHECTPTAPCAGPSSLAPPPCTTGDACKPGPTPQPTLFGEPSSETFSGAGNVAAATPQQKTTPRSVTSTQRLAKALRACAKRPKRKRAGCKRQARRRFGAKRSRAKRSASGNHG